MVFDDVLAVGLKIIDKFIPDPQEKLKAQQVLQDMQHSELMAFLEADKAAVQAQVDTNKIEATSASLFVSGWRPFVGWTCGAAFCMNVVVIPAINVVLIAKGLPEVHVALDTALIASTLFGMLGIGGFRTIEKIKGVTK
jgi:hypothetical protein